MKLNNFHKVIENTPKEVKDKVKKWMDDLDKDHIDREDSQHGEHSGSVAYLGDFSPKSEWE